MRPMEEAVLTSFVQIAGQRVGEDTFFAGLKSVMGMIFNNHVFQLFIGNFGIIIPVAELIVYLSRVGFDSYIKARAKAKTAYTVQTSPSGLFVANNTNVATLSTTPVPLAASITLRRVDIFTLSNDLAIQSLLRKKVSSEDAVKILFESHSEGERYICPECAKVITIFCGTQIGHAAYCSQNACRRAEWCDECLTDLTRNKHKENCRRVLLSH